MECLQSLCYLKQKSIFLENDCFIVFLTGYLDFPALLMFCLPLVLEMRGEIAPHPS